MNQAENVVLAPQQPTTTYDDRPIEPLQVGIDRNHRDDNLGFGRGHGSQTLFREFKAMRKLQQIYSSG